MMRRRRIIAVALTIEVAAMTPAGAAERRALSLVTDERPGPAARHGLAKLTAALKGRGVAVRRVDSSAEVGGDGAVIVSGVAGAGGVADEVIKRLGVDAPKGAESLLVRRVKWRGRAALIVSGGDDRGLMYALLDVAERVGWAAEGADPLAEVADTAEKPYVAERALSKYTMHRGHFESFFHDEAYWARYLDMLAACRFNTFVLIFGYENGGYFAPPYPYFFDTDGYAGVRVVGITPAEQKRNLASLNRLIDMCHARGLSFTVGIWDHIYRGGVQGPTEHAKRATPGLVWGLNRDNLAAYTKAALRKFLKLAGDFDAIQFRMHGESGLKRQEMLTFWPEVYGILNEARPGLRFDARAKNFPDVLIDKAVEMGVNIRICTKYWCEQMGMPFHPTHVPKPNQHDRRHGYADLLRHPRRYKMHWRMWNGGTTRVLLWGDPDYVRRFAASTHLYDGEGFEVNEPLATKMQDHPHDEKPFELMGPACRYYDWEFERYWHFFQLFGRIGYNPKTPPAVWGRQFERRFGPEAGPLVERALHRASQVLPRINACVFPYGHFPTTRGWPEKQRRGDLPAYAKVIVGDTQQFQTMDEASRLLLTGAESAKRSPAATGEWFAKASADVLKLAAEAEKRIGGRGGKEFASTIVDLKILANLALFHSRRVHAGLWWRLFERTKDLHAFDEAITREGRAIEAWESLVAAAGDGYHHDLKFGRARSGLSGHWRDELAALRKGLAKLRKSRDARLPPANSPVAIAHVPVRRAAPGGQIVVRATVAGAKRLTAVRVLWRGGEGEYRAIEMKRTRAAMYRAAIPAPAVAGRLWYYIEAAEKGGRVHRSPAGGPEAPVAVAVSADREAPAVAHDPIASAPAGKPLTVAAEVRDPSGVKWVRLRYRAVNQTLDYQTLPMRPTGEAGRYEAVVPAEHLDAKWDFMYLIEVMDNAGNAAIWPDLEKRDPYVIVRLKRGG